MKYLKKLIGGKAHDEVYMDILPEDYKGKSITDVYFSNNL